MGNVLGFGFLFVFWFFKSSNTLLMVKTDGTVKTVATVTS